MRVESSSRSDIKPDTRHQTRLDHNRRTTLNNPDKTQ